MTNEVKVGVYKLHKDAILPFKGSELSACYDICACLHTETIKVHGRNMGVPVENFGEENAYFQLFPDEMVLVPTGMVFILPTTHHLKMYSRSGNVWKRMLKVGNQPAVIDSDYTLETFVLLHNQSTERLIIKNGEAIAQGELVANIDGDFREIEDKDNFDQCCKLIQRYSSRAGGLGSTDGVGGVINTKV